MNPKTGISAPNIIAIDGPAASGKSTIGKLLADEFGYLFFDTGLMYRAVTWVGLRQSIDPHNENAITSIAEEIDIDVALPSAPDGRNCDVRVGDQDITWEIRSPEVDGAVSIVSAYPGVRAAMTKLQRQIGLRGNVVMVGRDIGTVVLPEADFKIYLEASAQERASRRMLELKQRGEEADYKEILHSLIQRDEIDSTRTVAPLRPADDSVIVDSDNLNIDQVINLIKELIVEREEG